MKEVLWLVFMNVNENASNYLLISETLYAHAKVNKLSF